MIGGIARSVVASRSNKIHSGCRENPDRITVTRRQRFYQGGRRYRLWQQLALEGRSGWRRRDNDNKVAKPSHRYVVSMFLINVQTKLISASSCNPLATPSTDCGEERRKHHQGGKRRRWRERGRIVKVRDTSRVPRASAAGSGEPNGLSKCMYVPSWPGWVDSSTPLTETSYPSTVARL